MFRAEIRAVFGARVRLIQCQNKKLQKKLHPNWKKIMLRKATKVHVYVQCFTLFF